MATTPPTPIATYTRTVRASLAGVWENVLDWEHLPWLHAETFTDIALLDANRNAWRARVGLQPAAARSEVLIEVVLARDALRYVTRTLEGPGAGSEIWTALEPRGDGETGIVVRFHIAGVPAGAEAFVGDYYLALYSKLWDEDEGMMRRRAAMTRRDEAVRGRSVTLPGTPVPIALGALDDVRRRLPIVIEMDGHTYRIVEIEGALVAHATVCPHRFGPLDVARVEGGCVRCPWHGYRYDVRSGRAADGRSFQLDVAPPIAVDPVSSEVRVLPIARTIDPRPPA